MRRAALLLALCALPAWAQEAPEGAEVAGTREELRRIALPKGPFAQGAVPMLEIEGAVRETAWRLPRRADPPLVLLAPRRAALLAEGFVPVYDCAAETCGGFDFRYALDILPEPQMHVDLGEYQYFLGRRGPDWAMVIASRSGASGFVQETRITGGASAQGPADPGAPGAAAAEAGQAGAGEAPPEAGPPAGPLTEPPPGPLAGRLAREGHAALDDLVFAPGADALEDRAYPSLEALAALLAAAPGRRAVLVGHTDATGPLAPNLALSLRRAEAVRARLIARHGVAAARISAEGAGWLAPRAANDTPEGRERNRRVEVMLLPR